ELPNNAPYSLRIYRTGYGVAPRGSRAASFDRDPRARGFLTAHCARTRRTNDANRLLWESSMLLQYSANPSTARDHRAQSSLGSPRAGPGFEPITGMGHGCRSLSRPGVAGRGRGLPVLLQFAAGQCQSRTGGVCAPEFRSGYALAGRGRELESPNLF